MGRQPTEQMQRRSKDLYRTDGFTGRGGGRRMVINKRKEMIISGLVIFGGERKKGRGFIADYLTGAN